MTEENLDNTSTLLNIKNENLFLTTIFLFHFIGDIKIEKCVKCCMMFEGQLEQQNYLQQRFLVQPTNPESSLSVLCLMMYGSVMSYHCLNLFYMDMIHKKFLCFILPKNHCFVGCESCYSSIKFKGQLYTLLCHLSIWSKNKRFSCC